MGCTDGRVRIWDVAEEEKEDLLRDPVSILSGEMVLNLLRFKFQNFYVFYEFGLKVSNVHANQKKMLYK